MKKILKWTGIVLGVLLLIILCAAFYLQNKFISLGERTFDQKVEMIAIPQDSAALARGAVLAVSCRDCHGQDYSGADFFNDPQIGFMASPNLTPHAGSAVAKYTTLDWIRALRHGLNPQGRPLMVMPAESYSKLSDEDLGALIAYMQTIPPKDKAIGPTKFTLFAKVLAGAGAFGDLYPYDIVPHDQVHHVTAPPKGLTSAYAEYIIGYSGCKTCHGQNLNGAPHPDPVAPFSSNITPGGNLGKWTKEQFIQTMRSGKTPEGKVLNGKFMPFTAIGVHDDQDLEALFNYLKKLPALPDAQPK